MPAAEGGVLCVGCLGELILEGWLEAWRQAAIAVLLE